MEDSTVGANCGTELVPLLGPVGPSHWLATYDSCSCPCLVTSLPILAELRNWDLNDYQDFHPVDDHCEKDCLSLEPLFDPGLRWVEWW